MTAKLVYRKAEFQKPPLIGRTVFAQKITPRPGGGVDVTLTIGEVIHEDPSGIIIDALADGMKSRPTGQRSVAYPFEFALQEEVDQYLKDIGE